MANTYVEYALSFGVQQFEGLWRMQYLHPLDAGTKLEAWVPFEEGIDRIGQEVDGIKVAEPGPRLKEAMGWLHNRITRYPYYWPKEGTYVDKFGYDFEVELNDKETRTIELTQVAYDILKVELAIQPEPVTTSGEITAETELIAGGGVLVKLSVTLDYAQPISELNLAPFTKYPLKIESLLYEEDIESYHPKKEILLNARQTDTSTHSVHMQFPVVTAKRLTLILRQANAEKNSYVSDLKNLSKTQLWNEVSRRDSALEKALPLDEEGKSTGWNIYLNQVQKHQQAILDWKREFERYKEEQAARLKEMENDSRFATMDSSYREEYKKAVIEYKTKMVEMASTSSNYERAYQQYEEELKLYNDYISR